MNERKPILCLDFDGVLHSYESGWKGADVIPDPPVPGAFEFIEAASEKFEIHIFSSRSNQEGGLEAMENWLTNHAIDALGLDRYMALKIVMDHEKPPAMLTIDDRAITFTGEWPDPDDLITFKPWNK